MTNRYIVIAIAALIGSNLSLNLNLSFAYASIARDLTDKESESGFYWLDGSVKSKINRPSINPDFAPDESCLFDTFQLKCVPGSQQECPEGFGRGEPQTCWAMTLVNGEWVRRCPEDYHTTDGDETGQCYPNSNNCTDASLIINGKQVYYVLRTGDDSPNPYDTCTDPRIVCETEPDHEVCKLILIDSVDPDKINSDDTITNDIPPDGIGLFCDHPSDPGGCYDRNDNPESFCANFGAQYPKFCDIIGEICDDSKGVNNIDSTDPECTDEDEDCPENYVRNGKYCSLYRLECNDPNVANSYKCNGKERTDGLLRCDERHHPGYKFCTDEIN